MTFTPWHLEYRPKTLEQIVGQPLIVRTLSNLISSGKLAGAFLFSGSRGTGKTSTARIVAKSLNCLNSSTPTVTPCGECHSCRSIDRASSMDVIEIDGASNNGVDEIRRLIEQSSLVPVSGRYRIFIIDEAHMLTKAGQNAFLKTLEEPNSNVLFILATTEPHKLLDTIISRCLHLRFTRISKADIIERLTEIAIKEEVKITSEALKAIANCSQGGMRDSIQLLYQLASTSEHIDSDRVYRAIGGISSELLHSLVEALINKQIHNLLDLTTQIVEADVEVQQVFTSILAVWKDLLAIALTNEKPTSTLDEASLSSPLPLRVLQSLANKLSADTIIAQFQQLEAAERRINYSSNSQLWLQTTLLSLVV